MKEFVGITQGWLISSESVKAWLLLAYHVLEQSNRGTAFYDINYIEIEQNINLNRYSASDSNPRLLLYSSIPLERSVSFDPPKVYLSSSFKILGTLVLGCLLDGCSKNPCFPKVCLGLRKGEVRVDHHGLIRKSNFIPAHGSGIACFALTNDGRLLATASTKGTLVRVFNTLNRSLLQEVCFKYFSMLEINKGFKHGFYAIYHFRVAE